MLLQRIQQIQSLGELDSSKRKSALLLTEKLYEKLLSRIPHFDCEDLLLLVRYLSKLSSTGYGSQDRVKFAQDAMILLEQRLQNQSLQHEIRLLYTYQNWMSLMININLTFGNVIIASGQPFKEGIIQANTSIGNILNEELKRMQFHNNQALDEKEIIVELINTFDQLTRFKSESYSVIKQLMNQIVNIVNRGDLILKILHIMTRIDIPIDPKVLDRLTRIVLLKIDIVTYSELSNFLESLLLLDYKPTAEFSQTIVRELENRQKKLVQGQKKEENKQAQEESKLSIQDALKIFRSMFQLGMHHEINQSSVLLRSFTNIIHKNKEKMTTNQTTEVLHMIRQTMLYPASNHIQKRLIQIHGSIREQFEAKIFKTSVHRLLLTMIQDRHTKDQYKIINASKEIKGNLIKCLLSHVNLLKYPSEVALISNLFSNQYYDEAKFINLVLSELSHCTKEIKDSFLKRKKYDSTLFDFLETMSKLVYLICLHDSHSGLQNQLSPQLIQGRAHWPEVEGHIKNLESIGAYDQYQGDSYENEIRRFQKMVLQGKCQIIRNINEIQQESQNEKGIARIERVNKGLQDKGVTGIEVRPKDIDIEGQIIDLDLYIKDKKLALKVIEHSKMSHDTRFIRDRSIIEENQILLMGDSTYTLSKQIMQTYNEAQLSPIITYSLKYYHGINYKLIDGKKIKDDLYLKHVVQLL